jgi:hypothetical protein
MKRSCPSTEEEISTSLDDGGKLLVHFNSIKQAKTIVRSADDPAVIFQLNICNNAINSLNNRSTSINFLFFNCMVATTTALPP